MIVKIKTVEEDYLRAGKLMNTLLKDEKDYENEDRSIIRALCEVSGENVEDFLRYIMSDKKLNKKCLLKILKQKNELFNLASRVLRSSLKEPLKEFLRGMRGNGVNEVSSYLLASVESTCALNFEKITKIYGVPKEFTKENILNLSVRIIEDIEKDVEYPSMSDKHRIIILWSIEIVSLIFFENNILEEVANELSESSSDM